MVAVWVFIAIDVSPKPSRWGVSSVPDRVLQVELLNNNRPTMLAFGLLLSQRKQASEVERSATSVALAQPDSASNPEAPFLRRPILFDPNSLEPCAAGRNILKRAATWLHEHGEARVLIVGSCDTSGSESCTHALAEARAAAIQRFLEVSGVRSEQIVGIKGWDNVDHSCRPTEIKCQQLSRSAQMFMASSALPLKE
jgi:outer membrane protein OmpA-like peptidoglycan-associated protein